METLTIGKLAQRAGVNIETIRYYERRGIMPRPLRTDAGYRQYRLDALRRMRFIRKAQELGFSLKEIDDLLSLRLDEKTPSAEVKKRAEEKIGQIEGKIRHLEEMKKTLCALSETCDGRGTVSECPILEALEN